MGTAASAAATKVVARGRRDRSHVARANGKAPGRGSGHLPVICPSFDSPRPLIDFTATGHSFLVSVLDKPSRTSTLFGMVKKDLPRLIPTGTCWCGCGKETSIGSFFA